jgi:hypothetical protein
MNKKVVSVFILAILAIGFLYFYSFYSVGRKGISNQTNPISLKPAKTEQIKIKDAPLVFNTYHNKDFKENFFTVQLPQNWKVSAGTTSGSYIFQFKTTSGTIALMDVPDNSSLELYVLSQEEPKLKKSLPSYKKIDYLKVMINKNETCQLIYTTDNVGLTNQHLRSYVSGTDEACVITLSSAQKDFEKNKTLFDSILNSFKWENK